MCNNNNSNNNLNLNKWVKELLLAMRLSAWVICFFSGLQLFRFHIRQHRNKIHTAGITRTTKQRLQARWCFSTVFLQIMTTLVLAATAQCQETQFLRHPASLFVSRVSNERVNQTTWCMENSTLFRATTSHDKFMSFPAHQSISYPKRKW